MTEAARMYAAGMLVASIPWALVLAVALRQAAKYHRLSLKLADRVNQLEYAAKYGVSHD